MNRGVNTLRHWTGDPERWGGSGVITMPLQADVQYTDVTFTGAQLLRAQTAELRALLWDIVISWGIDGVANARVDGDLTLDVTIGTGQASSLVSVPIGHITTATIAKLTPSTSLATGMIPWTQYASFAAGPGAILDPPIPDGSIVHVTSFSLTSDNPNSGYFKLHDNISIGAFLQWFVLPGSGGIIASPPIDWWTAPGTQISIENGTPGGTRTECTLNGYITTSSSMLIPTAAPAARAVSGVASPFSVIACSINAVPRIKLTAFSPGVDSVVRATITAHCAPRVFPV